MKALILSFLFITCSLYCSADKNTIKVLLNTKENGALIEVKGRYKVYNIADEQLLYKSHMGHRYYLYPNEKGIKWGNNFPSIHQIKIVPQDPTTPLFVNGIQYRGAIEIYHFDEKINIVNEVEIEEYLKQTLSHQITENYEKEVCDCIAILARTNAYYLTNKHAHFFWHISAADAAFEGYALAGQNPLLDQSISMTSNIILTYNDEPFPTAWTQNCAGKTADYFAIFRKDAITPEGVSSPLALQDREQSYWEYAISKRALSTLVGLPSIREIDLYLDKRSDKVYAIKAKDEHDAIDLRFFEIQNFLGSSNLRSNDFTIDHTADTFLFKGYGSGHSVGLCLHSADLMAEQGEDALSILNLFFPSAKIKKIKKSSSLYPSTSKTLY